MKEKNAGLTIKKRAFESTKHMSDNEIADAIRKASASFLKSEEWLMLRAQAIVNCGCICMRCGEKMKTLSAINVDHIKPRKLFPHLASDINNLQVLCRTCNRIKSNKHDVDYRKQRVDYKVE